MFETVSPNVEVARDSDIRGMFGVRCHNSGSQISGIRNGECGRWKSGGVKDELRNVNSLSKE